MFVSSAGKNYWLARLLNLLYIIIILTTDMQIINGFSLLLWP